MSHYDELRDKYDSMSFEEKMKIRDADEAREVSNTYVNVLKSRLLELYIKENSNFNEEFSHSKDYWDKKTNDTKILISKLG